MTRVVQNGQAVDLPSDFAGTTGNGLVAGPGQTIHRFRSGPRWISFLADDAEGGGSESIPAWVPEGAIGFIDIPNQRAWSEGDGEVALADVMTGYNAADINALGLYMSAPTTNIAFRLLPDTFFADQIISATFSLVVDCTIGAFLDQAYHPILSIGAIGGNLAFLIENWEGPGEFIYIHAGTDYGTNLGPPLAPGSTVRAGLIAGPTGVDGSVNGGPVVHDNTLPGTVDPNELFFGCQGIYRTVTGRFKYIEFY